MGVVVHGLWQFLGVAVRLVVAGRKPYVVFVHGMLDPYFKQAYPAKHLKKKMFWWVQEYWVLRGARFALFTSRAEARLARESFLPWRWEERVVPYGASAGVGEPEVLRERFLAVHPELRGVAFVLFLGRLHAKKGCELLVEALAAVAGGESELRLVFAGPDPDGVGVGLRAAAEVLGVGGRVHLLGMAEGEEKWGAFYACSVFALPSHQENFGIAVAEAMSCGKAVLISDKVNIWEEVVEDGAGFVGPDDLDGTRETLKRWIALSGEERAAMGIRARECFERRFDMRKNTVRIVAILRDAFGGAEASGD